MNETPTNQPPQEEIPPAPVNIEAVTAELKSVIKGFNEIEESETAHDPETLKELDDRLKKVLSLFQYVTIHGTEDERTAIIALLTIENTDGSFLAVYFIKHPKLKPEILRDCSPEVGKVESLMAEFEAKHSLAELNAITELSPDLVLLFKYADELENPEKVEKVIKCYQLNNPGYIETYKAKIAAVREIVLTPEDARVFKIRREAKAEERVIMDMVEKIRKETNISKVELEELQAKRKLITNAVGYTNTLNGNVVLHDR
jgi:hypothetical protein